MQDTGRPSGGADLRCAARATLESPHDRLAIALRSDATVGDIRDARALGRLRRDLTAIRDAPHVETPECPVAAFSNPWAALADGRERPVLQDVLARLLPLVLLAAALLAAAGILSLLGGMGPALVTSLDIGPGLSVLPGAD